MPALRFSFRRIMVIAGIFVLFTASATAQIQPLHITGHIQLDGSLNEAEWSQATPISDFTQRELEEGAQPTEPTEVRILFDDDNLYIGVTCFDSEPGRIISREQGWDNSLAADDYFTFVLDTYHDYRMAYYFSVNPNGARFDATLLGSSGAMNREWDGIWDVRSRITDQGWSFEAVIPFKSLRFPAAVEQTWGVNFRRIIRRKNEEVLWRAWARNDGVDKLNKYGTISFTGRMESGHQLDVKPYLLTGAEKLRGNKIDDTFKYGLDVKVGITSNTTLDLTTRTDFAQIESDREVINLTRYNISYPEKRDFFLEGSDTFDFSQGPMRLFYSRRIGISPDRRPVPIIGGAKLTQKSGDFRLGVMTMQTEAEYGYPSTNYSVVRVKKDVLERSYIGLIATSVFDTDDHDNQVYGMDMGYITDRFLGDQNLEIHSYLSGSVTDGSTEDNMAGRVYVNFPNDLFQGTLLYHAREAGFNPEIGFTNRVGVQQYMLTTGYTPRPNIPGIKKLDFVPFYLNYYTDMGTRLMSRSVDVKPFGIITNSDDEVGFTVTNCYEYYDADFRIFGNYYIPQGSYEWWQYELALESSRNRPVSIDVTTQFGDYYDGSRDLYEAEVYFRNTKYYSLSADIAYNRISINGRSFQTREIGGRLLVDVNTRLSSSAFVQYNNDSDEVNVNFRIHYIPRIGSDIYLVYNSLSYFDDADRFSTLQSTGMLKLDYTYRF